MKASKKLLSLLLVVMLLVSAIPFQVLADGPSPDTAPVQVPVKVVVGDKEYSKRMTVTSDSAIKLTEEFAMGNTELVSSPGDKEFVGWFAADGETSVLGNDLPYDWVKGEIDNNSGYSLVLKLRMKNAPQEPQDPEESEDPTYSLTVKVFRKGTKVTEQTLTEQTTVTLNDALLKSVYADFDTTKEKIDKWYENGLGETQITDSSLTLNSNKTIAVNIVDKTPVSYHKIQVFAVMYVGNVRKGVVSDPIFDSGNISGTVNLLDYLNEYYVEIENNAEALAVNATMGSNPTFYNNKELTSKVVNTTLTDATKTVYVRVDVPEVKNVLLYVHKGTELSKLTHLDPKVLHGYVEGSYVTYEDVQAVLGKNVKFYGLFTEERWNNRNANIKDDALPQIQVPAGGVEIHVWVTSGSVYNADPTNPKTGDYILDTALTLMVLSAMAAAAVYVVGKKRRV